MNINYLQDIEIWHFIWPFIKNEKQNFSGTPWEDDTVAGCWWWWRHCHLLVNDDFSLLSDTIDTVTGLSLQGWVPARIIPSIHIHMASILSTTAHLLLHQRRNGGRHKPTSKRMMENWKTKMLWVLFFLLINGEINTYVSSYFWVSVSKLIGDLRL